MIDKPISAKILLNLANENISSVNFIGLSNTLYRQNLIFSEPKELRQDKNKLELTIVFRDIYSFKNWDKNKKIKEFWFTKFDRLLSYKPITIQEQNVIIEADSVTNCVCKKSEFYILQGRSLQFIDELTCNKCLSQISYSKVPLKIELEDWQTKYRRFYLNWLESGLFENEALLELTDYKKGKLNLAGEKIRKQLSDFFKLPVYMNYFTEEQGSIKTCPICKLKGINSGLKHLNKICKNCNSIFGNDKL